MSQYFIPPASAHANPLSVKKSDSQVKELTQCQFCMKSKKEGVTLFKCAGCLSELYCSKECQKKAWPNHKIKCKLNQKASRSTRSPKDNALVVLVRQRPAKRPELAYFALYADVVPLDTFGERAEEMREQLKIVTEHNKQTGLSGTFFVVLRDIDSNLSNIAPVGYPSTLGYNERRPWKEWMIKHLNEGILN